MFVNFFQNNHLDSSGHVVVLSIIDGIKCKSVDKESRIGFSRICLVHNVNSIELIWNQYMYHSLAGWRANQTF